MKIAILQLASPDAETVPQRLDRVEGEIRALPPVDLIVLPELWSVGYFSFDEYASLAETIDGPLVSRFAALARERGCHLHLGSFVERAESGRYRNTSVLIGPEGAVVNSFSKLHIFGYRSRETELLEPGNSLAMAELPFGKTTGITCYDLRFPGLWSEMSARGVEVVIIPAAWPAARREHWRALTTARAIEHQVLVIACNSAGEQHGVTLGGHSRVVGPGGELLGECGPGETTLIVEVDPAEVARVRAEFPVILDRRTDYAQLTGETA